ncbi:hypothetical protein [Methanospirillum hungatei]|jgi:hypothetical protein|uniref:hypothetical protein n=1 Tax=Methanospirillum hungatei TaxID=2203 RepID=UPI001B3CD979|nr:hypothetical protein [Methanospirillum hungatei]MBP9007886.1 hypothetical protein [Methanospirillum sp.]HOW05370.1 hypothetical protein [Methanospirillum hungatei]
MNWLKFMGIFLVLLFLITAGCTSHVPAGQEKTPDAAVPDNISEKTGEEFSTIKNSDPLQMTTDQEKDESTASSSDDDRYFYNIRIVAPSDLESLKNEIHADEYPIYNENGDLIGIVSPRKLYIRGDLVDLQKETGKTGKTFDKTDVAEHLVDIVFGNDNAKLNLFKSNKDYQFWLDAYYTTDDTKYLLELAKLLNTLSDTTEFEDEELALGFLKTNYADVPYNFYNIKIIPQKMLDEFKDNRKSDERLIKDSEGKLIGIVGNDHLYLVDSMSFDDRKYYMLYGTLYSMGMHGTTYSEKDSFFYQVGGVRNTELSDLDKEAIKLLYGGRLKTGIDMEEMKKTLGLKT